MQVLLLSKISSMRMMKLQQRYTSSIISFPPNVQDGLTPWVQCGPGGRSSVNELNVNSFRMHRFSRSIYC